MRPDKQTLNIVVAINLSGSSGRRVLSGILGEYRLSRAANLRILGAPRDLLAEQLDETVDGIITFGAPETADLLAGSRIPLVVLDFVPSHLYRRKENISFIVEDNERIGRLGARHLLSIGRTASIGFVPDSQNRGWSRIRERAFVGQIRAAELVPHVHRPADEKLDDWLKALPKPAAVMTAFDFLSKEVLNACARARLAVPDQVAVLGVDNDRILCEHAMPPLSSIDYDQEEFGRLAIRTIFRMIRAKKPWGRHKLTIETREHVVDRASVKPVTISAHLSARVQTFVESHYAEDISVADVVHELGVSRRLIELRLAEAGLPSVRRLIEDRRIKRLEHLLKTTALPVAKATRLAGFANVQRAKYVFKQRSGVTMTAYRAAKRK